MASPSKAKVAVVDLDLGNVGSVAKAFGRESNLVSVLGSPAQLLGEPFSHLVLPGVGSFEVGVSRIRRLGWDEAILHWISEDRPFLGICLGMQLLCNSSEEVGAGGCAVTGLGVFDTPVNRIVVQHPLKVPHVGWNSVTWTGSPSPLNSESRETIDFYFSNSFALSPEFNDRASGVFEHGQRYPAVVQSGKCFGVQFHPEKSQLPGRNLICNFLAVT